MHTNAIFFLVMLWPITAKTNLLGSHKTSKFGNRRQHARNLDLTDYIYYLPKTYKDEEAFNHSKSLSFEEVVKELRDIGVLDLPNVSVIRLSNSTQPQDHASPATVRLEKRHCSNPCGGCSTETTAEMYNLHGVAGLKVWPVQCNVAICFNGQGECQKIKRHYKLYGKVQGAWKSKTIEVDVDCACTRSP